MGPTGPGAQQGPMPAHTGPRGFNRGIFNAGLLLLLLLLLLLFPTLQVGVVRIICQTRPPPAGLLQSLMRHRTTYGDGRSSQWDPVSRPLANSMQTLLQSLMTHRTTYGDGRSSQWDPDSRPPANSMQTLLQSLMTHRTTLQCKFNEISMQVQSDVNANSRQIQCKCSSTSMQIQ